MGYSELIKNFERIRGYLQEFYIYGFKTREAYDKKSGRSYDNERRRVESYLGDYVMSRRTKNGKTVFLSIDSRNICQNPFYQSLKSKSFTDNDITFHFIIFDILYSKEVSLSTNAIMEKMDAVYFSQFSSPTILDISTVRKKLKEYVELGLMAAEPCGRQILYHRNAEMDLSDWEDAIAFFSEVGGCGVIGNFLLDQTTYRNSVFFFKHHYINRALDSEVLCNIFLALSEKREIIMTYASRRGNGDNRFSVVPLKIFVSVQNGRQYLFAYQLHSRQIRSYRLDCIHDVICGEIREDFAGLAERFAKMRKHLWGVSLSKNNRMEHVEFTIRITEKESYIYYRLEREKRCGTVEWLDQHTCKFSADVYDTSEMVPWIRTFIGRIASLRFSNRTIENQLKQDIEDMYQLYQIGEDI
mgnify:FL=1